MTARSPTASSITVHKGVGLTGRVRMPGDTGLSQLSVMLGGLSTGITRITGLSRSDGVSRTLAVIQALGALVRREGERIDIHGRGVGGLRQPSGPLDCGHSTVAAHLALGAVAGHDITVEVVGASALAGQSLQPLLTPLRQMGLSVASDRSSLPLVVRGSGSLVPVIHRLDVPSEVIKHAILLAGLGATGETTVTEPACAQGQGWRLFRHLGADIRMERRDHQVSTTVCGDAELEGRDVVVPGDATLAAVLAIAAAIVPGSDVALDGVPVDADRPGLLEALKGLGADISTSKLREESGFAVADVRVRYRALQGGRVSPEFVQSLATQLPLLVAAAAFAGGEIRFDGLDGLLEADRQRVAAMVASLTARGAATAMDGRALLVGGGAPPRGSIEAGDVLDPIVATALLVAGLGSEQPVVIHDGGAIARRFPDLRSLLGHLGARIDSQV